jgi:hypothetical protein
MAHRGTLATKTKGGNKLLLHVLRNKTELTGCDFYYFKEKIDTRERFYIIASRYLGSKKT